MVEVLGDDIMVMVVVTVICGMVGEGSVSQPLWSEKLALQFRIGVIRGFRMGSFES
jgi:hypothetical protein